MKGGPALAAVARGAAESDTEVLPLTVGMRAKFIIRGVVRSV